MCLHPGAGGVGGAGCWYSMQRLLPQTLPPPPQLPPQTLPPPPQFTSIHDKPYPLNFAIKEQGLIEAPNNEFLTRKISFNQCLYRTLSSSSGKMASPNTEQQFIIHSARNDAISDPTTDITNPANLSPSIRPELGAL